MHSVHLQKALTMKKRHTNSHSHSPAKQVHKEISKNNTSNFTTFSQSFFSIFTEKDKLESQIYNDMKCVDASKGK